MAAGRILRLLEADGLTSFTEQMGRANAATEAARESLADYFDRTKGEKRRSLRELGSTEA